MVSQWRVCFCIIKFHNENISASYLVIETTFEGCVGVMFSPSDLLIASSELQLVVVLTLFITSARFSWRNLSVSGLVIFADFLRQDDKYRNTCMSPSTNILAYPIDSVANIVNSIKDDKIGKRAKFCILDELQHFRNVLFGLFARSSDSSPNRLFTTSLFTHAPKEKKRAKWSRSTQGGGSGSGSHKITRK